MSRRTDTILDYQLGPARRFARRLVTKILYRIYLRKRLVTTQDFKTYGISLRIFPSVFHPLFFRSSIYFADVLLRSFDFANKRILDVGCGSGILSLLAAKMGAYVVAVDLNPEAVRSTRENAERNDLYDRVEVLVSDVFEDVPRGNVYDYIITNPPFFRANPRSLADLAWRTNPQQPFLKRVAEGARLLLKENGEVVCLLSSDGDVRGEIEEFERAGFVSRIIETKRFLFERLYVFSFMLEQRTSGPPMGHEAFGAKQQSA